jgi:hypothetical protein
MKILSTSNYSLFSCNPFQRKFKQGKVDVIKSKMKKNGFPPSMAISVYRDSSAGLTINTGHHRLAAAKELGIPVLYVIEHQWKISEMVDEGVTSSAWDIVAVVTASAKKGVKDYQELLAYADKGIPLGMAASLLIGEGASSGNARNKIDSGEFKIKNRAQANKVVAMIEEFADRIPAIKSRSFISAFSKCLFTPEFDDAMLSRRLRANPMGLEKTSNEDQMLSQIESVYNHKSSSKIPLAFFVKSNSKARHQSFGSK